MFSKQSILKHGELWGFSRWCIHHILEEKASYSRKIEIYTFIWKLFMVPSLIFFGIFGTLYPLNQVNWVKMSKMFTNNSHLILFDYLKFETTRLVQRAFFRKVLETFGKFWAHLAPKPKKLWSLWEVISSTLKFWLINVWWNLYILLQIYNKNITKKNVFDFLAIVF